MSRQLPVLNSRFFDGMNLQVANYFNAACIENDYGKSCAILHHGYYGLIYPPFAGINGLAWWKTNPGMTLQTRHPSIEVISSDPQTGMHRINVKYDATDTIERTVKYDGGVPTFIQVTRDGLEGEFSPEGLNARLGSFIRNLDMGVQNAIGQNDDGQLDDGLTDASPFNRSARIEALPFERQVRFIAARRAIDPNFYGMIDVIPIDRTEDQRRARARYMRDHGGGAYYIFQVANEDPWNVRFSGVLRVILEGFRHGFYGSGTASKPAAPLKVYGQGSYINRGDKVSPITEAGGYVLFQIGGIGVVIMQARKAVPLGAPVDDNEFWQTVYDHTTCQNVGKNYHAYYLDRTCDIVREEYGDDRYNAEVVPVMMGQNGAAGGNGSVLGQFAQHRAFVPGLWPKVKGIGWASYLDTGGADGFDAAAATADSYAAWIRYKAWPHLQSQLAVLQQEADSEGKIAILYEGGLAMSENVNYGGQALRDANVAYFTSDEAAKMAADYIAHLRLHFRGVAMYFSAIAADRLAGTDLSIFGMRPSFTHTTSKRYIGYLAGLDGSYMPRDEVAPTPLPAPLPAPDERDPAPTAPAPKATKAQVLAAMTAIDKATTAARALANGKKVDPVAVQAALGKTMAAAEAAQKVAGGYRK